MHPHRVDLSLDVLLDLLALFPMRLDLRVCLGQSECDPVVKRRRERIASRCQALAAPAAALRHGRKGEEEEQQQWEE